MELLKGSSKHGVTTIQNLSDTECMNETELSMPVKDVQEGGVLRPKNLHQDCVTWYCTLPPLLQVNVIVITLFLTKLDHRPLFYYIYY